MLKFLLAMPRAATLGCIRLYQRTLSPDTGVFAPLFPYGFCRYHPTCSEYTHQAIRRYGLLKGSALGAYRILRCNPFARSGFDPLT